MKAIKKQIEPILIKDDLLLAKKVKQYTKRKAFAGNNNVAILVKSPIPSENTMSIQLCAAAMIIIALIHCDSCSFALFL